MFVNGTVFGVLAWVLLTSFAKPISVERSTYIISMDKSFMPKPFTSPHYWYSSIIDSFKSVEYGSESSPFILYTYDNALHGFSAILSLDELDTLNKSQGFITAYSNTTVTLATTHTPEFLSLDTFAGLWAAVNYKNDIIIGVVDSGVWPKSPSFKDDGKTTKPPAK